MKKYRKPAKLKGWDFSQVRVIEEGPRIDYLKVVKSHLGRNKTLLAVGTGGGERLEAFVPRVKEAIGIDIDRKMIKTATEDFDKRRLNNVKLILCDSEKMPIAGAHIDIIIDRHAPFNAREVSRILKLGGILSLSRFQRETSATLRRSFKGGSHMGKRWVH